MTSVIRLVQRAALLTLVSAAPLFAQESRWVGTWATAATTDFTATGVVRDGLRDQTVRQIVPATIGATAIRVRLSNAKGDRMITLRDVYIGRHERDATIVDGSNRLITFGGQRTIGVPAGGEVLSDAVPFALAPAQDVSVTFYAPATGRLTTGESGAVSYVAAGNVAADVRGNGFSKLAGAVLLVGVDALADPSVRGSVAVIGASSTAGGRGSYPGILASRFLTERKDRPMSVLNYSMSGNRLLRDSPCWGTSGMARFNELLLQPNLKAIIVSALSGNDVRHASKPDGAKSPTELQWPDMAARCWGDRTPITTADLAAGLTQLVERAHVRGIRIYWTPIPPFRSLPSEQAMVAELNEWARTSKVFDGFFDLATPCINANDPTTLSPACDSGDGLHPSAEGSRIWANAIDLAVLAGDSSK